MVVFSCFGFWLAAAACFFVLRLLIVLLSPLLGFVLLAADCLVLCMCLLGFAVCCCWVLIGCGADWFASWCCLLFCCGLLVVCACCGYLCRLGLVAVCGRWFSFVIALVL